MNFEAMTLSEKINSSEWQAARRAECRAALHPFFTGQDLSGMKDTQKVDFIRSVAGDDISIKKAWAIIHVMNAHIAASCRARGGWVGFPEMWTEALELCKEASRAMNQVICTQM